MPIPTARSPAPLAKPPRTPIFSHPATHARPDTDVTAGTMRKAYKFRIYPTSKQAKLLQQELAAAQGLYNAALDQRRTAWKRCRRSLTYLDQAADLKDLRASNTPTPANYSACQDVLRRLDKAFKAFFRRLREGGKPGFPRFRSRDRYDSITYPSYGDGCRIRGNRKLYLQGVGELRVKWHREIKGTILRWTCLLKR